MAPPHTRLILHCMATTALQHWRAAPVHSVVLSGKKVAYRRFGRGPAVVLVHGWPLSGVTYRGLVERLGRDFCCYVPDLPGAGDSPADPDLVDLFTDFGGLIVQFADALELDRLSLVGHDSGGTIARVAAAQLGDRVSAVALTNTEVPGHIPALVRVFQGLAHLPGARIVFQWLMRSRAFRRSRFGFGGAFENIDLVDGEFSETTCAPLARDIRNALASLRNADFGIAHRLPQLHAKIEAPLLCLWGDSDPFFPVAGARAIIEQWAGPAELELLPGKKLLVHEEAPELVAARISQWLTEANTQQTRATHRASA